MTQYIIIGNGIAANSAAEQIRKCDQSGSIVMFTREKHCFYYIPSLPELLSGEKDAGGITIHGAQWYRDNNIELHSETEITEIDPDTKSVRDHSGNSYAYDKLLLATGGYSFVPPINGSDLEGVYALRTLDDAERIKAKAASSKNLVLIGGGLLGLEAGNGLRKAGLKVTVVEFFPRLLPRQMDTQGAAILQHRMEEMGFTFHLGAKTREIKRSGERLSVQLETGETIDADMVLISAGVRPELTLAKDLGLDIDKGLKVNDTMETGIEDIYAAGDLIEHKSRFYGIWPAAMEQGRVAGANMAGADERYGGTVPANTLKVVGISLTSAGNIDPDNALEAIIIQDARQGMYRKMVIENKKIVGTILFGNEAGNDKILALLKTGQDISEMLEKLSSADFKFSGQQVDE